MKNNIALVSIIVSTYNRPDMLRSVLLALGKQTSKNFEVIIADDGSDEQTKILIDSIKTKLDYNITHVWQPHDGFRAAAIRNKSVLVAKGEYLVFLDSDCIPLTSFITRHLELAQAGYFTSGNRVLLSQSFTKQILQDFIPIYQWNMWQWILAFCTKKINRFTSLFYLKTLYPRYKYCHKWQGAKTCNLAVWKQDFLVINGFDESYVGWGYEDSDLIVRLMHNKILRKDGRFAISVMHLWHPENCRDNALINYNKFQNLLKKDVTARPIF